MSPRLGPAGLALGVETVALFRFFDRVAIVVQDCAAHSPLGSRHEARGPVFGETLGKVLEMFPQLCAGPHHERNGV